MSRLVYYTVVCWFTFIVLHGIPEASANENGGNKEAHSILANHTERYKLVSFNFHHVEVPYVICLWILLASIAKMGFHLYDKLPHIFPESCLLITLGILVGATLYYTDTADSTQYSLDANTFFLFLLPPIIYDAGYHMPNKAFFNNLGTILLLAVVNTLYNIVGIGTCLWGMSALGWIHVKVSFLNCLVFSSFISAVDPVAVLAIFEEIQVNEILYIIVFGESLLNDGVSVVIYHMMEGFTEIGAENLETVDFLTGFAQFFVVVFGGTFIGILFGLIGAFLTKYTDHVRVLEPLFIFILGYLAYLTAESMELSGILALTFGGIVMRHYTELNMAKKSTTTVKYFMKMLANISETIIFMFLGLSVIMDTHDFQPDFILFTILFCLVFRVTGVMFLSYVANQKRMIRLTAIDQFIMSYGGLRGGIAFCLALLINEQHIPEKSMFVSTTIVMVFFTVFIQGITIKPVVNALKVERAEEKDPSMNEMIHKRFIDHMMAGVEDIAGRAGHNSLQNRFEYYNTKYLKPWLTREHKTQETRIVKVFTKMHLNEAKAAAKSYMNISRAPSYTQLHNPGSPYEGFYSRRSTIAVPTELDHETIVNMHMSDPGLVKRSPEDEVMQQVLGEGMISTRANVRERRHTMAEVHNQTTDTELRNFIQELHGSSLEGVANGAPHQLRVPYLPNGVKKKTSFSGVHTRLNKQLSDVAEMVQKEDESSFTEEKNKPVFTLGNHSHSDGDSQKSKSPPPYVTVIPLSAPNDNTPTSLHNNNIQQTSAADPQPSTAADSHYNISSPPLSPSSPASQLSTTAADSFSQNIPPSSHPPSSSNIPIAPDRPRRRRSRQSVRSESSTNTEDKNNDMNNEVFINPSESLPSTETLAVAESSLPWRRTSSLPPVPSSLSLSYNDEDAPLHAEPPSWADNLMYSGLTETGSPYHSPQTTITAQRVEANPRAVFDIFPQQPSSPADKQQDNDSSGGIPFPWSKRYNEDEALPSHSNAVAENGGDKVSSFLMSPHDFAPPAYHALLQQQVHSKLDGSSRPKPHSSASPHNFPHMDKSDAFTNNAMESEIIGIETDYLHGMTDRVSQWLASSSNADPDEDKEREETKEKILDSLRHKKGNNYDTDEGTDADTEDADDDGANDSDDMQDTRL